MTASLTAMSEDGLTVDLSQIEKMANDLVSQGVTGAFVNGTSGQSLSLSVEERKQILEAWHNTKAAKSGKLTIIPHIGANSMKDTLELADHAVSLGVFAIGAMPPSFFKPNNAKAAAEYLIHIAHRHPKVPVYYYHIPSMTGVNVSCSDSLSIAKEYAPNVVGCKFTDSLFVDLQRAASRNFTCLVGADDMLTYALAAGSHGAIGISYNFTGRLHRKILDEFEKGNIQKAEELQKISGEIFHIIKSTGNVFSACYYCTEKLRGVNFGAMRYPHHNATAESRKILDQMIIKYQKELDDNSKFQQKTTNEYNYMLPRKSKELVPDVCLSAKKSRDMCLLHYDSMYCQVEIEKYQKCISNNL